MSDYLDDLDNLEETPFSTDKRSTSTKKIMASDSLPKYLPIKK